MTAMDDKEHAVTEPLRPIEWTGSGLRVIDQTALPGRLIHVDLSTVDAVVDAIVRLAVRGAPQLGAVGAIGVVIAMDQGAREGWDDARLQAEIDRVRNARPTAVNLMWGVDKVRPLVAQGRAAVLAAALELIAEDERINRTMAKLGADWIQARVPGRVRILTHCNTGALATTAWGTAFGVIRELHDRGALEVVYVDETRPLLQGARLTAYELAHDGIPYFVQADGAAAGTILRGLVDVAIIGADRIAANGDTANKVGSVGVALACQEAGIPFMVAAPESTIDMATPDGDAIHIEMRGDDEVVNWAGVRTAPEGARAHNPAFDVTPARMIAALVTETCVMEVRMGETPGSRLVAPR
ncbi:MAG TPA: S-methyl-5-thioribose-1-phosphate isomerase [Candidatus Limnocylindrales bacterium]|jgi:methylthioribose-1-phosphate isomerase